MTSTIVALGVHGTRGQKGGSSSFLLNELTSIDAGNLIVPLGEKSAMLEAIWLTHSHLDHIVDIAFIIDNYYEIREKTLHIYALEETIEALRMHIFNHTIWPDFSNIPLSNNKGMCIAYHTIECGKSYHLEEQVSLLPLATDHTVKSCGYEITKEGKKIVITADTYSLQSIVTHINRKEDISGLVVECSFPSYMDKLAKESKHLTPKLLFSALEAIENKDLRLYINHIKPEYKLHICEEIEQTKGLWDVTILEDGDSISF